MQEEAKSPKASESAFNQAETKDDVLPLMPLWRKTLWEVKFPPKCPLDNINFIQLKKFEQFKEQIHAMGSGFDLIEEGC